MKILMTLDYELFLGKRTGTVAKCLMEPMDAFLRLGEEYGLRYTLFVDASYLYMLDKLGSKYSNLSDDLDLIKKELLRIQNKGHEIQLHIHPQWYYSTYDGTAWKLDETHYKFSDMPINDAVKYIVDSKSLLDDIIGHKTTAFRAGGFSAQPTWLLTGIFDAAGIKADASVCPGTWYESPQQKYDYRICTDKSLYRFTDDICTEEPHGRYTEIPISMFPLSPLFYWKLIWSRIVKSRKHQRFGDGDSVKTTYASILDRLTEKTWAMGTIDGLKISFLKNVMSYNRKKGRDLLCVLGHPKLATPYSINELGNFCKSVAKDDVFVTISELYE